MFRQPIALIAKSIRRASQIERVTKGIASVKAFGDRRLIENAEKHTLL